jgi:uncharacterized protein (UPF0332 family)
MLKKDLARKTEADKAQVGELLKKAEEDLEDAKYNLAGGKYGWAVVIAYNAMLSAGRALMSSKGYRPSSESHHLSVVQFCAAVMPADTIELTSLFNKYRAKRHDIVYGETRKTGKEEAARAIRKAGEFVRIIRKISNG